MVVSKIVLIFAMLQYLAATPPRRNVSTYINVVECLCVASYLLLQNFLNLQPLLPWESPASSDEDLQMAAEWVDEQDALHTSTPRTNRRLTSDRENIDPLRRTPGADRPRTPRPPSPDIFASPEARGWTGDTVTSYLLQSGAIIQVDNVCTNKKCNLKGIFF